MTAPPIGVAAATGCSTPRERPGLAESFENGLGDCESTTAIGPEIDLEDFESKVGISDSEAVDVS